MTHKMFTKPLLLVAVILGAALASAQQAPKAVLKLDKPTAIAGSVVKGKIILTFAEGLHGYQNPPTVDYQIPVKVTAAKGTTLVKTMYPAGVPFTMAGEDRPSLVYEGTIEIPVQIKATTKLGKGAVKLVVDYQQCNESSCFPPAKIDLSAPLTVVKKP